MKHPADIAQFLASGIVCQGVSKTGQFGEGFFLWDEISQADCLFSCYQLRNCIADKKCWGAYLTTVISKFKLCLAATTLKIFTIINLIFPLLFIVMNSV